MISKEVCERVLLRAVSTGADYAELFAENTLDHSVHMMTTAFELWDFGAWTPILEATLYTGLFQVGRAVLDGTFHQRGKEKKNIQEG